ncbi:unnamed protein product [Absidia cylindrospora]
MAFKDNKFTVNTFDLDGRHVLKIKRPVIDKQLWTFYRLGIFALDAIEKYHLNGVPCFQTSGPSTTFYYMLSPRGFRVASVTIPVVKNDILSIASSLDELVSVTALHNGINTWNPDAETTSFPVMLN